MYVLSLMTVKGLTIKQQCLLFNILDRLLEKESEIIMFERLGYLMIIKIKILP